MKMSAWACFKFSALALCTVTSTTMTVQHQAYASEAMIIGGGSHVHNSDVRFENSVRWIGSVLSEYEVTYTTHFNDGEAIEPDIHYTVTDPSPPRPLTRIFGNSDLDTRRFRNHKLNNVATGTRIKDLESAIGLRLNENINDELVLIHSGLGSYKGTSEDTVSMDLWGNDALSTARLHQLLEQHERPVRFVLAHSHSGGFHRLAYRDVSTGLMLTDTTHCGFTAQSAYGRAEVASDNPTDIYYRDYLSYFFSALSGYEYDGQIISRFADLNEDGQTSLREAHLYSLEEAMSIDLPLSTSEDYLLRWHPWYLRWQPAPKLLPNNEYTRVFRNLANRLGIPLQANVANIIRERMQLANTRVKAVEQRLAQQQTDITRLQTTIQTSLIARWPALASPYTQDFQMLIRSDKLPRIESFAEQLQPEYETLKTLQGQVSQSRLEHLEKRREAAQYQKLLQLRYLALVKQQLIQHGNGQQISDYRSLLRCEQAPISATSAATVLTEDATQ